MLWLYSYYCYFLSLYVDHRFIACCCHNQKGKGKVTILFKLLLTSYFLALSFFPLQGETVWTVPNNETPTVQQPFPMGPPTLTEAHTATPHVQ